MDARRFGRFRFDPRTRTLWAEGEIVALQPRTAHLLELLLAASPELVARDQLFAALWPDGFVEDGNLAQQVYHLRGALERDPAVRIETVRGCGYRLVAPAPPPPVVAAAPAAPVRASDGHGRRLAVAAIAVAAMLVAVAMPSSNVRGQQAVLAGPAATEYRVGMSQFQRRSHDGFRKALRAFERTVQLAPGQPQGYAGRGLMTVSRASVQAEMPGGGPHLYDGAERDARQALALGEDSNAHAILGFIALRRDADSTVAIGQLRRAIELDPHNAIAQEWHGIALLYAGRVTAARDQFQQAVLEDPSCALNFYWLMIAQYYDREYDAAERTANELLTLDPGEGMHSAALMMREMVAETRGDVAAAAALADQFNDKHEACYRATTAFRLAHLRRPQISAADRRLAPSCTSSDADDLAGVSTMLVLGRDDDAMRLLRDQRVSHAWSSHFAALYDPRLERLRKRADFAELLR